MSTNKIVWRNLALQHISNSKVPLNRHYKGFVTDKRTLLRHSQKCLLTNNIRTNYYGTIQLIKQKVGKFTANKTKIVQLQLNQFSTVFVCSPPLLFCDEVVSTAQTHNPGPKEKKPYYFYQRLTTMT